VRFCGFRKTFPHAFLNDVPGRRAAGNIFHFWSHAMKWLKFTKLAAGVAAGSLLAAHANAAGRLVVYCSATNAMCENAVQQFSKKHDVKASFIRNGSGSTFAKVDNNLYK